MNLLPSAYASVTGPGVSITVRIISYRRDPIKKHNIPNEDKIQPRICVITSSSNFKITIPNPIKDTAVRTQASHVLSFASHVLSLLNFSIPPRFSSITVFVVEYSSGSAVAAVAFEPTLEGKVLGEVAFDMGVRNREVRRGPRFLGTEF